MQTLSIAFVLLSLLLKFLLLRSEVSVLNTISSREFDEISGVRESRRTSRLRKLQESPDDEEYQEPFRNITATTEAYERKNWKEIFNNRESYEELPKNQTLKIAFCITGQLARLELLSKFVNVFLPNAELGHTPHIFVYLDNEIDDVKQTYWNYNYSETLYGAFNRQDLKAYLDRMTSDAGYSKEYIRTRVKLEPPTRYEFHVVKDKVPVVAKPFTGHDGPKTNYESAERRFQNNMRWMAGLRDCVKWVQLAELQQGFFYDLVVRLREDTFAVGPWLFSPPYMNHLTTDNTGNYAGRINDHNFAIDRKWADTLFRGLTEDYYFNSTLEDIMWETPEKRIYTLALSYNIPIRRVNICQQPLVPLRGLVNFSYWRVHPLYVRLFKDDCAVYRCCDHDWEETVRLRAVPVDVVDDVVNDVAEDAV